MKPYIEITVAVLLIGVLFASYHIESWIRKYKHVPELNVQWTSYPIVALGLESKNIQMQIMPINIGFREDGVVVWREPHQSPSMN